MSAIRITESQLRRAAEAHEAALEKDPDFKAFHKELERKEQKATKQREEKRKS